MDMTEVEALFAQAVLGDPEGEEAWAAVSALRRHGSREIFDYAAAWCLSEDPLKRARAADILCQLQREPLPHDQVQNPEWMFREESYSLITKMLENEQDPLVLSSAITALGHLDNKSAISWILPYLDHPNQNVRFAVSFSLGCFPNDPQSIQGLLKLTIDPAADVRDWAVFGLGVQGDADWPEVREALLRCLIDADEDVREEAAVGLGKRRDQRTTEPHS